MYFAPSLRYDKAARERMRAGERAFLRQAALTAAQREAEVRRAQREAAADAAGNLGIDFSPQAQPSDADLLAEAARELGLDVDADGHVVVR